MKVKKALPVIFILALAIAGILYLIFIGRARRQKIERYNRVYAVIKVGDPRDTVVAAMGEPHTVTTCSYTPFSDSNMEAEFRSKCFQQYKYVVLMKEYTISFDRNGAVIGKSNAVSP